MKWQSSKPAIATEKSGKITGKKKGTSVVTATYQGKKYNCKVTVVKATLALSDTRATIIAGNNKTIYVKQNGKKVTKGVEWKSANASVAAVSSAGKITAKSRGTAKIQAVYLGKTLTCTVTVNPVVIKLSSAAVTMTVGDQKTITLNKNGSKVTSNVTWRSSNPGVASVSGGKITASFEGTATVYAKYNNKEYPCSVTVKQEVLPVKLSDTNVTMELNRYYKLQLLEGKSGSEKNVTGSAQWTCSPNTMISFIDMVGQGMRSNEVGSCKVTATYKNKTYTCNVIVKAPNAIQEVILEVEQEEIRATKYGDVSLTAVYENGDKKDVTSQASWESSDEVVLSTTMGPAQAGKVYGAEEGKAELSGTYEGKTATVAMTVVPKYNLEETGFDASTDMNKEPGVKNTYVKFTCTDQEVLDQYVAENQDAVDKGEAEPYDISSDSAPATISYTTDCNTMTYTFNKLPGTLEELETIDLDDMFDPMAANILAIAMMDEEKWTYGDGFNAANDKYDLPIYDMFEYLNGPNDETEISNDQKDDAWSSMMDMIRTADGNGRFCYFDGATPANGYSPNTPYTFTLVESPYFLPEMEGVAIKNYPKRYMILVYFKGADSPRYCDVYESTSKGCFFSWFKSWRNLLSTIKGVDIEW